MSSYSYKGIGVNTITYTTGGTTNTPYGINFPTVTVPAGQNFANVDPAGLDSLSEIVANFNINGMNYASRLTWLENVVADSLDAGGNGLLQVSLIRGIGLGPDLMIDSHVNMYAICEIYHI